MLHAMNATTTTHAAWVGGLTDLRTVQPLNPSPFNMPQRRWHAGSRADQWRGGMSTTRPLQVTNTRDVYPAPVQLVLTFPAVVVAAGVGGARSQILVTG